MRRTNTWIDAFNTGEAAVDLGDGITTRLPTGNPASRITALETAKVTIDNTVGRRAFAWDAGNTRAQMIYGDTGTRAILLPGTTDQYIYLRRVGSVVDVVFNTMKPNVTGTAQYIGIIPTGYRPALSRYFTTSGYWSSEDIRKARITSAGTMDIQLLVADDILNANIQWTTNDTWPSTLPGTAWAGAI